MESAKLWDEMKPIFDKTFSSLDSLIRFGIGDESKRAYANKQKLSSIYDCLCRYKMLSHKQIALAKIIAEITERDEKSIANDTQVDWRALRNTPKPYRSMYT